MNPEQRHQHLLALAATMQARGECLAVDCLALCVHLELTGRPNDAAIVRRHVDHFRRAAAAFENRDAGEAYTYLVTVPHDVGRN